jgi:aquaporin Z
VIHLANIPVDGTSLNPAPSLGVAWFAGGGALAQVWLFIIGPIVGAAIAGATYAIITGAGTADVGVVQNPELARRQQPA